MSNTNLTQLEKRLRRKKDKTFKPHKVFLRLSDAAYRQLCIRAAENNSARPGVMAKNIF